jgi:hypothetical protein
MIINAQTPTYDLLSHDFDILQEAIRTKLNEVPSWPAIAHVKGHQDRTKFLLWHEFDLRLKINMLADQQADNIYWKQPRRTGLFPTWIPGTRAALLFHGEQQVTKGIHPAYIRDAAHTTPMKE